MERSQALQIVGLDEAASSEQVARVIQVQTDELISRVKTAPTPALRQKYEAALREIEQAALHLGVTVTPSTPFPGNHNTPLSTTKLYDLPSSTPIALTMQPFSDDQQGGLKAGQVLAGRYTIRVLVGQGGMGAVYAAFDQNLGEEIAIKVLTPSLLRNEQARERFLNEARTYSRLSHENIINVHDVQRDGELYFITMELLKGRSLRQELITRQRSNTPFNVEEIRNVVRQVSSALDYAHASTVHRDVKPENIWLGEDGKVKLMDFGIARMLSTGRMTQTAMVMGTAGYMAPEQLSGTGEVDARADQYALAVVVYEMFAGVVPGVRMKPLHEVRPDTGPALSAVLDRALEQNAFDRYPTAGDFARALDRVRAGKRAGKPLRYAAAAVCVAAAGYAAVATEPGRKAVAYVRDTVVAPGPVAKATLQAANHNTIKLRVDAVPQNATALLIYRSTKPAGEFEPCGECRADAPEFNDTLGVEPDTRYYYKVVAKNSAGKVSDLASAMPFDVESMPDVVPPPVDLKIEPSGAEGMKLSWKPAKAKPGTTFDLLRRVGKDGEFIPVKQDLSLSAEELAHEDVNLSPGTEYQYRIQARYKGLASAAVNFPVKRTQYKKPDAPVVEVTEARENAVALKWDGQFDPGTLIRIQQATSENGIYSQAGEAVATSRSFEIAGLKPDTRYFFKMVALNQDQVASDPTSPLAVNTAPQVPGAITNLKAELLPSGKVRLTWGINDPKPTEFKIRRQIENDSFADLQTLKADVSTFEFETKLENDERLEVLAINKEIAGKSASIVLPAVPKITAESDPSGVRVKWQTSSKVTRSFSLLRKDERNAIEEILPNITGSETLDDSALPGAKYTYFVKATSEGASAVSQGATGERAPDAPVLNAKASSPNSAELTWSRLKADGKIKEFELQRLDQGQLSKTIPLPAAALSHSESDLKPDTKYTYKLVAIAHSGTRSAAGEFEVTTPAPPPPRGIACTNTGAEDRCSQEVRTHGVQEGREKSSITAKGRAGSRYQPILRKQTGKVRCARNG